MDEDNQNTTELSEKLPENPDGKSGFWPVFKNSCSGMVGLIIAPLVVIIILAGLLYLVENSWYQSARDKISDLTVSRAELVQSKEDVEENIEKTKQDLEAQLLTMKTEDDAYEKVVLARQIDSLEDDLSIFEDEKNKLQNQIDDLQGQIGQLEDKSNVNGAGTKVSPFDKKDEEDNLVFYEGEGLVSGTYQFLHNTGILQDQLCFFVDEDTDYVIPREGDDKRPAWFCFTNQEFAQEKFDISLKDINVRGKCGIEGLAIVEISDYIKNTMQSEVADEAELDQVMFAGIPEYVECE